MNQAETRTEHARNEAAWLLDRLVSSDEFVDFLTRPAYEIVNAVVAKEQLAA